MWCGLWALKVWEQMRERRDRQRGKRMEFIHASASKEKDLSSADASIIPISERIHSSARGGIVLH